MESRDSRGRELMGFGSQGLMIGEHETGRGISDGSEMIARRLSEVSNSRELMDTDY